MKTRIIVFNGSCVTYSQDMEILPLPRVGERIWMNGSSKDSNWKKLHLEVTLIEYDLTKETIGIITKEL